MHTLSLPASLVDMIVVFPATCSDNEVRLVAQAKAPR